MLLEAALAGALSACGGGGGGAAPAGTSLRSEGATALQAAMTTIQGPECITDTSGRWLSELTQGQRHAAAPPPKKFFLAVRYVHSIETPITTNFGRLGALEVTDFDPEAGVQAKDYGRWQRGRADGDAGTTSGFQMKCSDVGSFINTSTFAPQALVGGGPHAAYFYDFRDPADPLTLERLPPVYDANPDTAFVLQTTVEVPLLQRSGPPDNEATGSLALAQLSMAAYLRDAQSGRLFAYVFNIYQNRASEVPRIAQDEEVVYVSTAWEDNDYVTLPATSAAYSSQPWSGLKHFSIQVPQDKFAFALKRINAFCAAPPNRSRPVCAAAGGSPPFSSDPRNYALVAFGMLHEVFTGLPGNQLSTGVHYRDVGAYRTQ